MKKFMASIATLVCIVGLAFPQARRHRRVKQTKPAKLLKAKKTAVATGSTVSLAFSFVTPDRDGGVWIGGTAWLDRGIMVNDGHGRVTAITVPEVRDVSDLLFVTPDIGWMADTRSIYRTLDRGNSWQRVEIPQEPEIRTVYFSDIQNGWAGGFKGEIYHTADAGQTWHKQETGLDYNFHQIFFVDSLHGWAVGWTNLTAPAQKQALIRTNDGGESWEIISNVDANSRLVVRPIFFVNVNEGWAIDNWNNIVHTTNGGKIWTIQSPSDGNSLNSLFFINDREGWASGDGILHTSDGGETWDYQRIRKQGENYLDEITFTDRKHGWAIGTLGALRTSDGGETWLPMPDDWKAMIPSFQELLKENSRKDVSKRQR